ncbi:MAG: AcvB/VirJ family lysyl-phosphatidylglycerol hydrolase [Steroidobacteraceae bacterium]
MDRFKLLPVRAGCLIVLLSLGAPWLQAADKPATAGAGGKPQHVQQVTRPARPDDALRFNYGRFGEVAVYQPAGKPTGVTLFVSGDGGWNLGVIDMAHHLVEQGSVVVGIDIRHYRNVLNEPSSSCQYFGSDFENLSHEVQQRLKLPEYLLPVMVGYSSGATLVYAVALQAPKGTFAGVMSLGFCPDLDLVQPICRTNGLEYDVQRARPRAGAAPSDNDPVKGVLFRTSTTNSTPWVVFQGDIDEVCNPPETRDFVNKTRNGMLVWLPKVGHGYSVERNWLPQFLQNYHSLATAALTPATPVAAEVRDLPVVEVPAKGQADTSTSNLYAVLLTGDGGWAGLDQDIADSLATRGIPVVAINSLKYYWKARDPAAAAADLQRVIQHYGRQWNRSKLLLIGYSFGADVLPYLYNRLPAATREAVVSTNLLGLSANATFEFHVSSWIPGSGSSGYPTVPEIGRMGSAKLLCLQGADEDDSSCASLRGANIKTVKLPGGHHFGGDYAALARQILDFAD